MIRTSCLWAVVASAACGAGTRPPAARPTPPAHDLNLPEAQVVLANGARVVVMPDPTTELVAVSVRYDVGSREDPPGRLGLAHLAEHVSAMVGMGAGGTLSDTLRDRAHFTNAFTTEDDMRTISAASPAALPDLLAAEAARLGPGCAAISDASFERERLVVRQEIRERTVRGLALAAAIASLFPPGHPRARLPVNEHAGVAAASKDDVCAFIAERYVPAAVTVVIAGKIDPKPTIALAETTLGAVPGRARPRRAPVPPIASPEARALFEDDVSGTTVLMAWPVPPTRTPEALGFITMALGVDNPIIRAALPPNAGYDVQIIGPSDASLLVISVSLLEEAYENDALGAVWRAVAQLLGDLTPGRAFEWLRYRTLVDVYLHLQSLTSRAYALAGWASIGESGTMRSIIRHVDDVDAAAVHDVAAAIFRQRPLIRVIKHGAAAAALPPLPPLPLAPEQRAAEDAVATKESDVAVPTGMAVGQTRAFALENGMRAVLVAHPDATFPIVSARLVFTAGSAHEPKDSGGIADVTAHLLEIPTRPYRFDGQRFLADPLEVAGARKSVTVTPDATVFAADVLDEGVEDLMNGLAAWPTGNLGASEGLEVAFTRHFTTSVLPQLFERVIAEAVEKRAFGADHPYVLRRITPDTIGRLTNGGLLAAWQRSVLHAANAILVVVGKFDPVQLEAVIRVKFGPWPHFDPTPPVTQPAAPDGGRTVIAQRYDGPRADVSVAFPGGLEHGRTDAIRLVIAAILDNEVRSIRERLGATYGVYATYQSRVGPGLYSVGGSVDPDRLPEAMAEIDKATTAVTAVRSIARRLTAAKRAVVSILVASADSVPAQASAIADAAAKGLPPDGPGQLASQVVAVTAEEVARLAIAELAPGREVIVVRAPERALAALRARHWKVKMIETR